MSKSKIHPDVPQNNGSSVPKDNGKLVRLLDGSDDHKPSKLTVWKRSSISFQGTDGFTVFDRCGRLVFRVDNYTRSKRCSVLLMDGDGNPLITLKPQKLSMQKQWNAYAGEAKRGSGESTPRLFSMRASSVGVLKSKSKTEAEVFMGGNKKSEPEFRIEGAFKCRSCDIVRVTDGQVVAKITRKRANSRVVLCDEVFSLELLQPAAELQAALAMAFVIVMDRICPSSSVAPVLCS